MGKKLLTSALLVLFAGLLPGFWGSPLLAQESFYKGKTIRIIVGFPAGGGYDTYARLIARHMGKYIPVNPTIIVENMTGAGSLISANHVYKVAKPDGLSIGHFIGGLFLQQLLGKPGIEFDARKFEYIGVPGQDDFMIAISKASGINSMDKWMASKVPVKLGGVTSGSGTDDLPNILKATLGLPVQLVSGYKGTADIRLAFNSGEVQGASNSWQSFKATWSRELEAGEAIIVLQETFKAHAELPNVPVAIDFAKTDEARKLIRVVVQVHGPTVRPFALPPGTPKERVQILRKAFMETMRDSEFLAEAKKAKLEINPLDGAELEQGINEILSLEPALIAKLKEILK